MYRLRELISDICPRGKYSSFKA